MVKGEFLQGPTRHETLPVGLSPAQAFIDGVEYIAEDDRQEASDDAAERIIAATPESERIEGFEETVRKTADVLTGLKPLPDKPEEGEE